MKQERTIKIGFFHHLTLVLVLLTMLTKTLAPTMVTLMGIDYELVTTDIEQELEEQEDTFKKEKITIKTIHASHKFGHHEPSTPYFSYQSSLLNNFHLEINSPPPDLG